MNGEYRKWEDWTRTFDPESVTITGVDSQKPSYRLNLILFLATVVTTLVAGTLMAG